jgi:hypothetical protein
VFCSPVRGLTCRIAPLPLPLRGARSAGQVPALERILDHGLKHLYATGGKSVQAAVRLSPGCPASRFQQVDDLIILR